MAEARKSPWEGLGHLRGWIGEAGTHLLPSGLPPRAFPFPFQAVCVDPRAALTTMTGLLKRKFDQLDEDSSSLCSSSSLSSSGRCSPACSPSSSVSPAWDSDEESPWDQMPLPDRDFCCPRSFTRESLCLGTPITLPPLFFLKRKWGALREVILTPGGRVPMALAPHLIHFPSYRGHQQMPPVQRPLGPARFTSDLGTLQPGSCDVQGRVLQWPWGLPTQLRPSVPVSFLQLAPCPLPAELLESHTPGFCAVGLVRPVPRPAKCCSALPEHSERVFPSYFSSLCNSNSKLTKMALEQYFSTLFLTVAPPTPRSPFRHFPPNHPHHDILIPQMCLHIYYMHICALYTEKYTF